MDIASPLAVSAASLTALTKAATTISSTLELDALVQAIARLACEVTRAEASTFSTLEKSGNKLTVNAATGPKGQAMVGTNFDATLGIAGQAVRTNRAVCVPDVRKDATFRSQIDDIGSRQTRTVMAAPMVHRAEIIGVLEVANRLDESNFGQEDLKLLRVLASMAAGALQNARSHAELQGKYKGLRESLAKPTQIVGDSPKLKELLTLCDRVASTNASVLIVGETGTGKELVARYIHRASRRRNAPFVPVNCAALTETLLESELFGHEKGSFTGAHAQRKGRFELAEKGTLFLDELGELSRQTQAKLLRVLQEKEFVRVGGTETIYSDVRIIAATNRHLKNMMADGLFRDDLYYRLNVFPLTVPPLRQRASDIRALVSHFVQKASREFRGPRLEVSPSALKILENYEWRGNIRELQNVMERSVLMSDGDTLWPEHLPPDIQATMIPEDEAEVSSTLHGQERALILKALQEYGWNQSKAARSLGVTRYHLRHRIRKYQLVKPE